LQRLDQDAQHLARHEQRMAFIVQGCDSYAMFDVMGFFEEASRMRGSALGRFSFLIQVSSIFC
jgi:hypothetical protein